MAISTAVIAVVGLAIGIAILASNMMRVKVHPQEPPVIHPKVPFFGHLIGMLQEGPAYLRKISERCKSPIFTLPILNGRTYVVTSPQLALAVQRACSTLDFDALIGAASPRLLGANAESTRIITDVKAKEEGRTSLVERLHSVIYPALAMNKLLDVTQTQLNHFSEFINNVEDGFETNLFHFITRELTAASMRSFYGPENPFALHPELIDAFWDWEAGTIPYMINVLPKITARKAYYGMEACIKGFIEYMENGRFTQADKLLQNRNRLHDEVGISIPEQARFEVGFAFGFSANAGISSFWAIQANALSASNTILFPKLRDACPLLNSVFRETLRLSALMVSARVVLEDTILADTYLLRKGSFVQIEGGIMHLDTNTWRPDTSSCKVLIMSLPLVNPYRFLYSTTGSKTNPDGRITEGKASTVHPAAFRAFGGGASLCPGRHFAQMEIISLCAVIAMGFDMEPVLGEEKISWDTPKDDINFSLTVTKPCKEVKVKLKRRTGYEHVKWVLER
ncbi:cytochrome P450 [Cucurbitaria berberidis CBS 394.84]|uniref:Cytochrome P450 n=1 Tax=Cucurbitaria berberidis CBS 394.84 TaxID=1168544 RepID=A0A9P4GM12_9PLEO|nr:cytochrome P450 [Cucurbitaria berberidis CBS 394.84]KAF1847919.1 cytochrome P450 [Cucurbitaria berberidis CBS 394.84]